jgi:hypothetical protein
MLDRSILPPVNQDDRVHEVELHVKELLCVCAFVCVCMCVCLRVCVCCCCVLSPLKKALCGPL